MSDFIQQPPDLGTPWGRKPPTCYDGGASIYAIISLVTTVASAAISYQANTTAARQAELNADAQNRALAAEQQRRAAEESEAQRRLVMEQRRFRRTQLARMQASGLQLGTGTPLSLEADTWQQQQLELADRSYRQSLEQRNLQYQRTSALAQGSQAAGQYRMQATGALVQGLGSVAAAGYNMYGATGTQATPAANTYPAFSTT